MPNIDDLNLKIIKPCEQLSAYVHSIWWAYQPLNSKKLEFKVLNDGSLGITINLLDTLLCYKGDQEITVNHWAAINGASTQLSRFIFTGKINTIGIRILPTANLYFSALATRTLSGKIKLINDDYFEGFDKLFNRLKAIDFNQTQAFNNIKTIIETHLIELLNKNLQERPYANNEALLKRLLDELSLNQEITLQQLCDKNSITLRQMQRVFKKYIGITPKDFMRLNRIRNIKTKISDNNFNSLTELSIDNGYFDQAHFIRDFKVLMDETPKKYHKIKTQRKVEKHQ